ncbi:MAG: glycosyltransferase [Planctomycetaceae bacterium]|nr:glycosyltransferase [Planctomycetaceae bacterium]
MTSPRRISLIIPTLDQSGAERQLTLLAMGLRQLGHSVEVIALNRGGFYEEILRGVGIPVRVLEKRFRFDPLTFFRLRRCLHASTPDIVQSFLFSANTYVRLPGVAPKSAKIIVSERCVDTWKSGWQLAIDRQLRNRMAAMTANSQSVADFYHQSVGVAEEKLVVIPNGVEINSDASPVASTGDDHTSPNGSGLRAELGLSSTAKLVGFVGRFAPQKRLTDLVWAFQLLHQVVDDVYLVLIGDGPERDELAKFARGLGCRERIFFAGHRQDARECLRQLNAFVLPSSFEGMSNSLLEAMACRVPVVVSDIPPNRELVTHEQSGLVFPVGDSPEIMKSCKRILENSEFAAQIAAEGHRFVVENLGVEQMVSAHVALYERLLAT